MFIQKRAHFFVIGLCDRKTEKAGDLGEAPLTAERLSAIVQ